MVNFILDDFTFLIVNFHFISSNIPASPAYGVYISQLVRYSKACAQHGDVLDKAQLLTLLLSWIHRYKYNTIVFTIWFDRSEISISQMTVDLLIFT